MESNCTLIPYSATGFFSKIIIDYLSNSDDVKQFYQFSPNTEGIQAALQQRKNFNTNRTVLVDELLKQYNALDISNVVKENISALQLANTFTVTTAHQPNIFTGPVFFIYKILHTIKLAEKLNNQFPENHFVPVYYMGSEDADIEELGNITIDEVKYEWQTNQTGAVGRMKVDKAFINLLSAIETQISLFEHGNELCEIFKQVYTEDKTIQQATLELINHLFGTYGLVVLIPDNQNLKCLFIPVVEKELQEKFSHTIVEQTVIDLEKKYKVQAAGRELNLFYLFENKRERIEIENGKFKIQSLELEFDEKEILQELHANPERFSPNVILRGLLQETILPNIAFVGGGGELAYWLELKNVFAAASVPYPVLILRNSFLIVEEKWKQKIDELELTDENIFSDEHELMNLIVTRKANAAIHLNGHLQQVENIYTAITELAGNVDATLKNNVAAIKAKAIKDLEELEKKMLRAEKRKHEIELNKIQKIKAALFPGNNLQERVENLSSFYAKYGNNFIEVLYANALSFEQSFAVLALA